MVVCRTGRMVSVMHHKYTVKVDNFGNVMYCKNAKRHRDGDSPSVIYTNGSVSYWKDGRRHRDGDKPAEIYVDGSVLYWKNGGQYEP